MLHALWAALCALALLLALYLDRFLLWSQCLRHTFTGAALLLRVQLLRCLRLALINAISTSPLSVSPHALAPLSHRVATHLRVHYCGPFELGLRTALAYIGAADRLATRLALVLSYNVGPTFGSTCYPSSVAETAYVLLTALYRLFLLCAQLLLFALT